MSTAFEVGGRPIINLNSDWENIFSPSSTVVLDPAAFLENWKKQIQGKHNIPASQQRLTFSSNHCPYPGITLFDCSCANQGQSANRPVTGDFVTCLQSWQAILRSGKHNVARLLDPEVLTESDKLPSELKSKTAEEFRDLGIPCSVYYLSFDKCILALQLHNCQGESQKEVSNLCIKVDKDFQLKEFEVDLYGRLSKSSHTLHFKYHLNGRHLVAHLSTLEQTTQYRQGQKMRHSLMKCNDIVDKLADINSIESLPDSNIISALVTPARDYLIPCSKEEVTVDIQKEVTVLISNNKLRRLYLPIIFLYGPCERPQILMPPRMQKNRRKEAGIIQQLKSQCLTSHLSESKTPECAKKKGIHSSKSRKSKSSFISESQPSEAEQESSNFQTDSTSGCSSTRKSADSSKSDDTSKKPLKKKKKKKSKRNPKNSSSDAPDLVLKESPEESSIASGINVTSISGSGNNPVYGDGRTNLQKNNIENACDPEMCTTPKGEISDSHFLCAEVFAPSTQHATSNTLNESSTKTINHTSSCNGYLNGGSGGVFNSEIGNMNGIMTVDSHGKNKHITQDGRGRETQSDDKKLRIAIGKKVAGNNCALASSASGSANCSALGNVHGKVGKENNHSIWQKVHKNAVNDHIHESGASDRIKLPPAVDTQNAVPVVNSDLAKNAPIRISQSNSHEYVYNESNHSKTKIRDSENDLEHCHIASYDNRNRFRVQEDRGRDANSLWIGDRHTVSSTHKIGAEVWKALEGKKKGCSRSERSIKSCQNGTSSFPWKTNHPGSLPVAGSCVCQRNAEMDNTHEVDKRKSSSAPSTPCQQGDAVQSHRDDFSLAGISSPVQGQVNRMLTLSRKSNSSAQKLSNEMTSTVHISEVQFVDESSFNSPFQKSSKTIDSQIRVSGGNDIDQQFNLQHAMQQEVPVQVNCVGMVMASTPDKTGVDSQCIDAENNVHEGSSENNNLVASDIGLKSTVPLQDIGTRKHIEQTNAVDNEHICEVSCECLSSVSSPTCSFNVEKKKKVEAISNSILASYESQLASENIAHTIKSPLAEFEKVLYSVAPVIELLPVADKCSNHSRKPGITNLVCRCKFSDIPLKSIWHWFEEPGDYGLEVKVDFRHSERFSMDGNLFRAYFVPFLSGIQLFGFSAPSQCAMSPARQKSNEEIREVEDSYLSHFENLPILSTLLPKPFVTEKIDAPIYSHSSEDSNLSSYFGDRSCSTSSEYSRYGEMEILFEYFESEQPQQRKPMLQKIKELIKVGAGSSSQVFGDPHILESIKLQDLHPASWFSVAWYPIYRIPEGQLHAAFLTYHSLGHFVHRDTSLNTVDGNIDSCIVTPVVGLQNYNAQSEGWFAPNKQLEIVLKENISPNPLDVLRERLRALEETASLMARGCAKKDTSFVSSKQSDYEFFLSRRR